MKSIKPGRGPSYLSGIVGILMACFGIVWTVMAARIGGLFFLFGIIWTLVVIVEVIYNFKNARSKNRYSAFDIVDDKEEPDPLNEKFHGGTEEEEEAPQIPQTLDGTVKYCPYCGTRVDESFKYCMNCGKRIHL